MTKKKHSIRLIFFSGDNEQIRKKILTVTEPLFPEDQINTHTTIDSFSSDLRKLDNYHRIILILTNTQKDLLSILFLKELLNNCNIILILPDTAKETMARACKLYPRYISYIQSDFKDVNFVLKKMIGNLQQKINGEKHDTNN
jgi:hypothetical protein